jgi:indolepyruvate ferredoxin oxidoreductase beta subunit
MSDIIPFGQADLIIALEPMESLRYLPWLASTGWVVTNSNPFNNIPDYPPVEDILTEIKKLKNHKIVDADTIAKKSGSVKSVNMVILGAASLFIGMPFSSIEDAVSKLFSSKGEEVVKLNLKALNAGLTYSQSPD